MLLPWRSIGCQEITYPGYNPTVKIQGKLCHRVGSLLPSETGQAPHFAQLYLYDTDHELANRLRQVSNLDPEILQDLQKSLHEYNTYIKSFKAAIEITDVQNIDVVLHADKRMKPSDAHCRTYNLPMASEVAAIMPGTTAGNLDVVVRCRDGGLQRINQVYRAYDLLHYVLLSPHGDDGWQLGLKRTNNHTLTPTAFYAYRFQIRQGDFNTVMKNRQLMQQYAFDAQAKIEHSRLLWAKNNQSTIRADKYQGLFDAVAEGDGVNAGRQIILSPSIYGTPRFYNECFQDSMTVIRHYGKPTSFITMTTNPKWPEITSALNPGKEARDRPDLCA